MIQIDSSACTRCGLCARDCTFGAIRMTGGQPVFYPENGCNQCGHCVAVCPAAAVSLPNSDMSQVIPYDKETFAIAPERLLNFIRFRRSVRHFQNRPVEDEKLAMILEAGRYTETGSNSQNVRYVVLRSPAAKEQLRRMALESLDRRADQILANPGNETPLMVRYAGIWKRMYREYLEKAPVPDTLLYGAPVAVMVITGQAINGGLAAESMELMTNALGLGAVFSGFIQRGCQNSPAMQAWLNMAPHEEAVACLLIGYPQLRYQRTVPRNPAQVTWL